MDLKRAMGAVMIGGRLASIVSTFVLVPVVFWHLVRFGRWLGVLATCLRERGQEARTEPA